MNTFTNKATLDFNGKIITSNSVQGIILDKIIVSKAVVKNNYKRVGDTIVYTIGINNKTNNDIVNVVFNDNLGEYPISDEAKVVPLTYSVGSLRFFENGVLQPKKEPTVDDGKIKLENITIPANGNVVLSYETIVNEYARLDVGSYIKNEAVFTGGNAIEAKAESIIYVEESPDLRIQKELYPTVIEENEREVTYRFIIENYGNMDVTAFSGLVLSDEFTPELSIDSVTINDRPAREGEDYQYDDGLFQTAEGRLTVEGATYTRSETGEITVTPGVTYVTISGELLPL